MAYLSIEGHDPSCTGTASGRTAVLAFASCAPCPEPSRARRQSWLSPRLSCNRTTACQRMPRVITLSGTFFLRRRRSSRYLRRRRTATRCPASSTTEIWYPPLLSYAVKLVPVPYRILTILSLLLPPLLPPAACARTCPMQLGPGQHYSRCHVAELLYAATV